MRIRERQERIERQTLSEYAAFADTSLGRARPETECDVRTAFCRDRDRIIHSKAFRRLKEKTQVFISPEGDHYRTRLTHTLEVSQIARTIARAMRLNEDLTEAIALGHDLGHTPFGHAGERALNELMPRGFRHYEQSARVVERIEKGGRGLNLTCETVDGILRHTTGELPRTVEGRVVRLADRIAYLNHDIEDAAAAGVPAALSLPADITEALGNGKSERITALVNSLLEHSSGRELRYGEEVRAAYDKLYDYMFENIYLNTDSDVKSEERKVRGLISRLFEHYVKNPEVLPEFCSPAGGDESPETAAADYISGMSDSYAMRCFEALFVPRAWTRE